MAPLERLLRFVAGTSVWAFSLASLGPLVALPLLETTSGRLVMVAFIALGNVPLALWLAARRSSTGFRRYRPLAFDLAILIACSACAIAFSPDGRPLPSSRLISRFPHGGGPSRYSPLNIFPETDQMALAIRASAFFDPILTREGARHVLDVMMPRYRAMAADSEYRSLGSVLDSAVHELAGREFRTGHTYEYVPVHSESERLPLVIFLHGSGGNFKAYLSSWREFADRYRCVVILPSFGFGNWWKEGGVEAIEAARTHALADLPVDPQRVYLIGLSNGGTGVTRAGGVFPSHYRGLGLLSAVIDTTGATPAFIEGWKRRPILIVHCEKDDRISVEYTKRAITVLTENGADVRSRIYPGEDHFLFMADLDSVLAEVADWMDLRAGYWPDVGTVREPAPFTGRPGHHVH